MTPADYLLLTVEVCVLGVLIYSIPGRLLKEGLRLFRPPPVVPPEVEDEGARARAARRLAVRRSASNRWIVRLTCGLLGVAVGLLPLWPGWTRLAWGPVLGGVAGGMCIPIHAAVEKLIPAVAALLPEALVGMLGGQAGLKRWASGGSVTGTMDTLDEELPSAEDISGYGGE